MTPCPLHLLSLEYVGGRSLGGFSLSHLAFSRRAQSKPMTIPMLELTSFLRAHRRLRPGDDHSRWLCVLLRSVEVSST